jgi:predicted nuclease with TOPRIM domain
MRMTELELAYQRIAQLEGENAALREENAALRDEVVMLKDKLASTQAQLDLRIRHVFGKKSEITPPGWVQQMLGLEPEEEKAAETAQITPEPNNTKKLKGGSKLGRKVQVKSRSGSHPQHARG